MSHILKCQECGSYNLSPSCRCSGTAVTPRPPKFSLEDKYSSYRRKAKEEDYRKRGLL